MPKQVETSFCRETKYSPASGYDEDTGNATAKYPGKKASYGGLNQETLLYGEPCACQVQVQQ